MYVKTSGEGMGCDERDRGWGVGGRMGDRGVAALWFIKLNFTFMCILFWFDII